MFHKILIANRGEIACRVIRTAKHLGIETVAIFSDADRNALHVTLADEAVHIGGSAPADSYLQMQRIIDAAKTTGSQAIHPGYGFLSENAAFCELCATNELVFIGPPVNAIEAMGSKAAAKQIMQRADVPLLPGYHGDDQDTTKLQQAANDMGYPVLLKAVAGGGGKGMRQVHEAGAFTEALAAAKREALAGFGNDDMLVEKYLEHARHVEVQVFCDSHGNGVYLFERDCSVQRRHQKIIEEAPAPNLSNSLRQQMGEAALRAASAVGYVGAGTVEFLLDAGGGFYFMEMNTRLQVEHPVTEMITGTDLVAWQLQVANGEPLPKNQQELSITGHALEARVYAENPENDFLPAAGSLWRLLQPEQNAHIRIDTGVIEGDDIGVFYDPMIAKLIVWGENREIALQRMKQALSRYRIAGVITNIDFLKRLVTNEAFTAAELRTDFIEQNHASLFARASNTLPVALAQIALYLMLAPNPASSHAQTADPTSPWLLQDAWRMNAPSQWQQTLLVGADEHGVTVNRTAQNEYHVVAAGETFQATADLVGERLECTLNGHRQTAEVFERGLNGSRDLMLFSGEHSFACQTKPLDLGEATDVSSGTGFKAPMNGTVVALFAEPGQQVDAGTTLAVMEAMKMEHAIKAPTAGTVTDVFYGIGDLVDGGADLLTFEAADPTD
jgi:3-methylcrotonyl-CoA carboxylase alpha subunit